MPRVCCTSLALAGACLLASPAQAQSESAGDARVITARAPRAQPAPVKRDWRREVFRDRDYFDPLIAEPRAPQISFNFPAWSNGFEFSVEPGNRLVWDISLGREIPIFTMTNFDDSTRVFPGSQGLGVWVDVSFHMIE